MVFTPLHLRRRPVTLAVSSKTSLRRLKPHRHLHQVVRLRQVRRHRLRACKLHLPPCSSTQTSALAVVHLVHLDRHLALHQKGSCHLRCKKLMLPSLRKSLSPHSCGRWTRNTIIVCGLPHMAAIARSLATPALEIRERPQKEPESRLVSTSESAPTPLLALQSVEAHRLGICQAESATAPVTCSK